MTEEGHLSASASSAHVFLPKNLWWHRGAAFHPQHAFHARRRQHRWEFETPAHNLDLTGTAQSSRKAAADKRNECVRLLYKAVSPLGLFSGVGLAPCPSPPSLWSYRALEEKSGWRALHSAFPRERSGNFADRNTGQHLQWDTKMWLCVVTKCLRPTDLLATTSDLVKPVPQSPLINGDLE